MYTSIIGVALSAVLGTTAAPHSPAWQDDYRLAREQGERERKPLVVVIGSGSTDWAKLARPADQDDTINQTLNNSYVCLFVDTDTTEGQRLAQSFDMTRGPGIVISDRAGTTQAYRHVGELPATELATTLVRHTDDKYVAEKLAPPPVARPATAYQPYFGSSPFGGACRT